MPTSLVSTGVQFPDSTIQTTAAAGGGFSQAQVFTSSGTFTVPSSGKFKVTIIGGGGGGPRGPTSAYAGQGGGSAGTVIKWYTGATAGATATVTIGSGGAGATVDNTAGSNGGNSTFALSGFTTLTAGGGAGGYQSIPPVKNNGTASGGDININGQNGMGPALRSDGGGNALAATLGGSTPLGLGAAWNYNANVTVSTNYPASGYGAGGGSGSGVWSTNGGAGTNGICIVEY